MAPAVEPGGDSENNHNERIAQNANEEKDTSYKKGVLTMLR